MTILSSDIRLLESERMTDTTDGGGRRTSREIPDGVAGNVFPKIGRVSAVSGRVNLRKIFPHVNTASLDVYADAHFIITDEPDNPRIHVTAFSTGNDFDTRAAARDRIESYVIAGPESRMVLYGRQLAGSQAIIAYQRVEEPLPEVGEVFAISAEVGSTVSAQQFVRAEDVVHEVRAFEDSQGTFQRRVITLRLGSVLRYEFTGVDSPYRSSGRGLATGVLRTTTVADAARYYGIQPLAAAADAGALTLSLASVYTPIVPTTQREAPVSMASIGASVAMQPCAPATLVEYLDLAGSGAAHVTRYLTRGIKPGTVYGWAHPGYVSVDDGLGNIAPVGAYGFSGTVDYITGVLVLQHNTLGTGLTMQEALALTYTPAAEVSQPAHTHAIAITLGTRGTVYAPTLGPVPAPGSLIVDYRAMGRWYRLRDNGQGELLGGDVAYGTGSVNYVTGAVVLTLGALPDVGSSILLSWGSPAHFAVRVGDAGASGYQAFTLPSVPVAEGSFEAIYTAAGTSYVITDAAGALSGGGVSGAINYHTGAVRIEYAARLPDFDSLLEVSYERLEPTTPGADLATTVNVPLQSGGLIEAGISLVAGSVVLQMALAVNGHTSLLVRLRDNGIGHIVCDAQSLYDGPRGVRALDGTVGAVNYATGEITITAPVQVQYQEWQSAALVASLVWLQVEGGATYVAGQSVNINTRTPAGAAGTPTPVAISLSVQDDVPVRVDLTRTTTSPVVPGSVLFTLHGQQFFDRNGLLLSGLDQDTGSATQTGTINYDSGVCTLSAWAPSAALGFSVQASLVTYGQWVGTDVFFRTAGSPLRAASLYLQVLAEDGEMLTATADQNGVVTGAHVRGAVEQTTGVVRAEFGAMVPAAGQETQPWYDPDNVVGANVWKPRRVQPSTLRYSAVVLSNLPLNADLLGLDPVRLPSDGRVPIVRPADLVVIHNTQTHDAGTPTAGSTISVGRTELSALWLEDADRKKLSTSLYVADLDAGTATMAADLSLTGYTPPIAVRHRIEEMQQVTDVQINGEIGLAAPLLKSFPLGSRVSSALVYGDLYARVTGVFDQQTWTGVWQDTRIGDSATAQYDDANYPIEVLNNGAVTERWRIHFTTTTSFQVIGENLGVIATGTTSADCAPSNTLTALPYFVIRAAGWGAGRAPGNQLRFNTLAAGAPTWLVRTVLPGAALTGDSFDAQLRGDVD